MFDVFTKRIFIGIDLGHFSVKSAVLGEGRKDILELAELQMLPDRQFIDQIPEEEEVVKLVRKTVEKYVESKAKSKPSFYASFHGEGSSGFYLELPKLKKEALETAVRSHAVRQIPLPPSEVSLTSIPVPPLGSEKEKSGIFVIALRNGPLDQTRDLFKRAGVHLERLESHLLPMIRGLLANHGTYPGEFVAAVHAGNRLTSVAVLREGNPYWLRDFTLGGRDFTYAFQMAEQISWRAAEDIKCGYNATWNKIPIEMVLVKWLNQVKRSIDAFQKQFKAHDASVSRVILTGGAGRMRGLDVRLQEVLNLPVQSESWERLKPERQEEPPSPGTFNVAVGLCI
jgi:type IV pilus assembly protein PilM